jgi:peptide deformylase
MGLRIILSDKDPTLRKPCREVTNFDKRLHMLLDDLAETLERADGAGLAAPQIGVLRRVCVVINEDELIELCNPVLMFKEGEQEGAEGCLSVNNKTGLVKRPNRVIVEAQDRHGKPIVFDCDDFLARVFCHEIDHLDGVMYIDKIEPGALKDVGEEE